MPARDQLERELALARARFAGDQHADRIHLHEHAVQRGARRERAREVILDVGQQFVTAPRRNPQRRVGFVRGVAQVGRHRLVLADDQRERGVVDDLLQRFPALARIERVEVGEFLGADDLHLVRVDRVEIADHRRPARSAGARVDHALLAALSTDPAQAEALLELVEQFAGGDAGVHAGGKRVRHRTQAAAWVSCQSARAA
jgi:hypothetical protein